MSDQKRPLTKPEEAAQTDTGAVQEVVPPYGDHIADDLYTELNPSYGSGLPTIDDPADEPLNQHQDAISSDQYLEEPVYTPPRSVSPLPPAAPEGPLSLTLDKALIFPNTVPATALYSLNFTLNTMGTSVTLRRSVPGPIRANGVQGKIVDKDLYDIKRPPFDLITFTLHGKRKSTFPGVGNLHLKSGFATKYWECKFKEKVVLKGKGGEWFDGQGRMVAREVNEVIPKKIKGKGKQNEVIIDDGVRENPGLEFAPREDAHDLLVDLLVACWCAKTWYAETLNAKSVSDVYSHVKSGQTLKGGINGNGRLWTKDGW